MKSVPKLIKRFVGILMLSSLVILFMNFIILAIIAATQAPNGSPWKTAEQAAESINKTEQGYVMPDTMIEELNAQNVWAVYIDNATGECVWHSDNLPDTVPLEYTVSDIANLTRGYIDGYPTFTGEGRKRADGSWLSQRQLLEAYVAELGLSIYCQLAQNRPYRFSYKYFYCFSHLYGSKHQTTEIYKPITDGIQALHTGQPIVLKEKGVLSEIAANINRTSEVLQSQNYQLRKKETARANWIAGVSHDIRTPLSMVQGLASQLESNKQLPEDERKKAAVIVKQSQRMKNLINDLNLASKLEYNMQPTHIEQVNVISAVRQVVVDFINLDISGKYPIEWLTDSDLNTLIINADKDLIKRAVSNLIQNSINHNENGCTIYVAVKEEYSKICKIVVSDNGVGATDEQIDKLNNSPHYMVCDENTSEQRHGLGLLIVKQIAVAHKGTVEIGHSKYGGLEVKICLPL